MVMNDDKGEGGGQPKDYYVITSEKIHKSFLSLLMFCSWIFDKNIIIDFLLEVLLIRKSVKSQTLHTLEFVDFQYYLSEIG